MYKHALYLGLGLADWLHCALITPPAGSPMTAQPSPRPPSWRRSGWALLGLGAALLLVGLLATLLMPPLAHGLETAGPSGLLWFAAAVLAKAATVLLMRLARFWCTVYRNGRAIHTGQRRAAWSR